MSVDSFIPEVWAGSVLTNLDELLAYGANGVINRDYEGDVSEYGGSVTVNLASDPAVETYIPYGAMTGGQAATTATTMPIDQFKAWAFDLDDVKKAQIRDDGDLINKLSRRAAHKLSLEADAFIASKMAAAVTPGAEVAVTTTNAYETLVDLGTELSENDVPQDGRWVVLNPAYHGLLQKDQRFVAAGDGQGATVRTSGLVGRAAGFDILLSNQVPEGPGATVGGSLIIAGHGMATTFANQVSRVESVRLPDRFVDRVRGLHAYGAMVVHAEALAARDVTF